MQIPSSIIEPAIAASIVYVAAKNFLSRNIDKRWRGTFCFGAIHGFGFASALQEFGSPRSAVISALASFNLGVEIGLFPRPNGTTYVCAISSEEPLPIDPARVAPDTGAIERLKAMCGSISPVLASAKILAWQACYRPVTRDGLPLIGLVPDVAGAYLATGHSVWGILNAPATGEAMAELMVAVAGSSAA